MESSAEVYHFNLRNCFLLIAPGILRLSSAVLRFCNAAWQYGDYTSYSLLCDVFYSFCLRCIHLVSKLPSIIRDTLDTESTQRSLSGVAMRQCVKLGYHRSIRKKNIDPLKIELSKRCFWVSYDMDRAAGVTLGRPFCIADRDIDAEVSSNVQNGCTLF